MTTPGGSFYYHYDPLGSTTNATGATQWTELYEPYGTIRTETKNDPAAPANMMRGSGGLHVDVNVLEGVNFISSESL